MDKMTKELYEKYGINPEEREKENQKLIDERLKNIETEFKELMLNELTEKFEKNFNSTKNYYLFTYGLFCFKELETYINENIKCLILEYYSASITLSNLILERMLKLALIQYEVGVVEKMEDWDSKYGVANKFSKLTLENSIKECKQRELIDENQEITLHEFRKKIRNGFSHYDPNQIFKDEDTIKVVVEPNENPQKNKHFEVDFKTIPVLQTLYVNKFAKENADEYFDFIMNIKRHFERHFLEKYYNENKI
jgi:hypothetical protein